MGLLDIVFDDRTDAPPGAAATGGLLNAAAPARPAGLLGASWDDPRTAANIAASISLLSPTGRRQGIMEGLARAMGAYQSTLASGRQQQTADQVRQMQAQHQQLLLQQAQRQAEVQKQQDAFRASLPSPQMQGIQGALAANGGPTNAAAAALPPADQNAEMLHGAMKAGLIDPVQYLSAIKKDHSPVKVGAGEALVDPRTYKPLFTNPKEDTTPSALKEYQFAVSQGYKGTFNDYQLALKRAGAQAITVDMRGDNAYSTAQGKEYSDLMAGINKAGFTAPAQLRKLERLSSLLEGVEGGKLAPTGLDVASALNSYGVKIDPRLGNKEAAQALARELAGGLRQPGTGPMTDKDFDNFLTQIPDLSKSAAGRKQITQTMQAALNRDMKVSQLAREYERKHGRIDGGFLDQVSAFIAENPVVAAPAGWVVQR